MGKLSRDRRDIYYRRAKQEGFRARSAYKLIQIDEEYDIFNDVTRAVDLCAAPGSWSQVLSTKLFNNSEKSQIQAKEADNSDSNNKETPLIVAVDLQEMAPIDGVNIIKGDITSQKTVNQILEYFQGKKADLVLCDGAPDVTGLHDIDEYIQNQLLISSLSITSKLMRKGGTFIAKIFRGENVSRIYQQMFYYFELVDCCKPESSRNSSLEAFIVCRFFKFDDNQDQSESSLSIPDPLTVPFISCGDLSEYDPDKTYEAEYSNSLEPIQPPINAPYH
ncbi:methylase [Cryptosporidium ubiquitum]|uniref:Putative tRNA (cytidine(32)/guanosine(34)-2'-O)-methyltransferase n=1 Tax=Cryptosporidium ubiquitum TaxID=857276 RepID=A0A1J4M963_9CRYT|nr:methylase [Cryptosporidium ubiquitum]OII70758.1 methylase [Cryptosporidium ubiquitum]